MNDHIDASTTPVAPLPGSFAEPAFAPEFTIEIPPQMPKALAEGLSVAQSKATTVENDGENTFHRYKYPTQAAIAARAREAMAAGGLFLVRLGYVLIPVPEFLQRVAQNVPCFVEATYRLGHKSGHSLPPITVRVPVIPEKGRPLDKAQSAALTLGHKYLLAGLFNMGWVDPTEDVDQRNDTQERPQTPRRQQKQRNAPKNSVPTNRVTAKPSKPQDKPKAPEAAPTEPKTHTPVTLQQQLRERARSAIGKLKGEFGFESTEDIYGAAAGQPWPEEPDAVDFLAIIQLAGACETARADNPEAEHPKTHEAFLEFCSGQDDPHFAPLIEKGEHTEFGKAAAAEALAPKTEGEAA